MKNIFIVLFVTLIIFVSCKTEDNIVKIKETKNCYLKYPYNIALNKDKEVFVVDRGKLLKINPNSGKISRIYTDNYFEDMYSEIDKYLPKNYFESLKTFKSLGWDDDAIRLVEISPEQEDMLINLMVARRRDKTTMGYLSVLFYKSSSESRMLFSDTTLSGEANRFLTGEQKAFVSDSLIFVATCPNFNKDTIPLDVQTLIVFCRYKGNFVFSQNINFPYLPEYNCIRNSPESPDFAVYYDHAFYENDNNIYASLGNMVYKINYNDNNYPAEKIFTTKNLIKSFMVSNDTIYAIERDKDKTYTINKYDIKANKDITGDLKLPVEKEIYSNRFINNELYIIFEKNDNFYILIKKLF